MRQEKILAFGGPLDGQYLPNKGPELKWPKPPPLKEIMYGEGSRAISIFTPEDRYIRRKYSANGKDIFVYIYEFDIDLLDEIEAKLKEQA